MTETKKECVCGQIDWQDLADYLENKAMLSGLAEARPIQRRRGTAMEHAEFVGLDGEITIDTTNKTIRVHDGETPGGSILAKLSDLADYTPSIDLPVDIDFDTLGEIASQYPNMDYVVETNQNGYTWYRKYKSGWVEQGGLNTNATGPVTITLPVEMADATYTILLGKYDVGATGIPAILSDTMTTTSFKISNANAGNSSRAYWEVKGMSA